MVSILIVIAQSSYIKLMGPSDKVNVKHLLTPLNPSLNKEIIDVIEKRTEYPMSDSLPLAPQTISPTPEVSSMENETSDVVLSPTNTPNEKDR
jgi:hypothetical protein